MTQVLGLVRPAEPVLALALTKRSLVFPILLFSSISLAHKNRLGLSEQIVFWEAVVDIQGESGEFYLYSCLPCVR